MHMLSISVLMHFIHLHHFVFFKFHTILTTNACTNFCRVKHKLETTMRYLQLIAFATAIAFATGRVSFGRLNGYRNDDFVDIESKYDHVPHRSLALEEELELQLLWWNWASCATPYPFDAMNFTPMSGVVPNNTVFLAGYPTYDIDNLPDTCKSKTITRTGTINTGQQTVFMSLQNLGSFDLEDDWEGNCLLQAETDNYRISTARNYDSTLTTPALVENLYIDIDGNNATPIYLYDETKRYLSACDNKDQTLTDGRFSVVWR